MGKFTIYTFNRNNKQNGEFLWNYHHTLKCLSKHKKPPLFLFFFSIVRHTVNDTKIGKKYFERDLYGFFPLFFRSFSFYFSGQIFIFSMLFFRLFIWRIRISFVSFFRLSSVWNLKLCNCIHSNEEEKIEQISIVLVSFLSKLVIKHWLTFSKATRFSFFFFCFFFSFFVCALEIGSARMESFLLSIFLSFRSVFEEIAFSFQN